MVVSNNATYNGAGYTQVLGDTSLHGAVVIPDSVMYGNRKYAVTRIKSFWAPNITNLSIPNTVRKIDMDALVLCGFSTLTIPVGVTSVGSGIAMNCPNLTTVYYNARSATQPAGSCGSLFSWTVRNVIIGDSVEYIPRCFCNQRDSLRTITILGNVKQIDEQAFSYCKNLRSILIPSSVEHIGCDAFTGCKNLDTVYYNATNCTSRYSRYDGPFHSTNIKMLFIGDSVQRIHLYTFDTVQTVISKNTTPPIVDCYARDDYNYYSYVTNAKVFTGISTDVIVPCGSADLYQSQYAWNRNTISDDCVTVTAASNDTSLGTAVGGITCSPNTQITLYALPSAGNTFIGWSDSNTDNPRNVVSISEDNTFTAIFSPKDTVVLHDTMVVVDTLIQHIDIHDTTYINVPYAVHDTTIIIDTLMLTEYVDIYDTTYIDVHDTTYINVPYAVHDTTTLYDTVTLTEYIAVHDTTVQKDTMYLPVYLHDTAYVTVHDTEILYDTVTLTEYVSVHDTTFVPIHDTTYVNVHDTAYITLNDTVTNTVYDTITNTVFDTTIVYSTDTLWLHDTVFVHDTIFIYDTIYVGVDEVETASIKIYTNNGQIVVDGAQGNTVWLFDVNGRVMATKHDEYSPLRFNVPESGAYLVKIGKHPARKVVVIR